MNYELDERFLTALGIDLVVAGPAIISNDPYPHSYSEEPHSYSEDPRQDLCAVDAVLGQYGEVDVACITFFMLTAIFTYSQLHHAAPTAPRAPGLCHFSASPAISAAHGPPYIGAAPTPRV